MAESGAIRMYTLRPLIFILGGAALVAAVVAGIFPIAAAIIGPKDNRMTYPEYVAKNLRNDVGAFHEKFSAAAIFGVSAPLNQLLSLDETIS